MLHRREIETGSDTCLLGYSGREHVSSAVFDATFAEQGGVSEVQTVTLTGSPGGGDFTLTFKDQTTSDIAYNAVAATVQAALRALSRIGSDGVAVTGNGPYVLTFTGRHANKDIELLTADGAGLTGGTTPGVTVAETTKGSALNAGLYVLECGLVLTRVGNKVRPYTAAGDTSEVQTATISGSPGGGNFTLEFDGEQTTAIAYNATGATVQTALVVLPNVDAGDVVVTGGAGGPYVITFGGQYSGESVPLIEATHALTGGTTPSIAVAQTTQGGTTEKICGIFDGRREFFDNTNLSDIAIPVYDKFCVFNKKKVQDYATYEDALLEWGAASDCQFRAQGASTY